MADPYLTLSSSAGTITLNEISQYGYGLEAGPGAVGFGLPPVDVQFSEIPGDGARYRYSRVQQRALDLVVGIAGDTRNELEYHFDRLSKVVAHPCVLTYTDPAEPQSWSLNVYRTGGGEYAHGLDDSGVQLAVDLSFATDDPYWVSSQEVVDTFPSLDPSYEITLTNSGSAGAKPIWEIHGPGYNWSATLPTGERLAFEGYVQAGVTVTIDCRTGECYDSNGFNRYADLGVNPNFFSIPPGITDVLIEYDRSSDEFNAQTSKVWTNHILNPDFAEDMADWNAGGMKYETINGGRVAQNDSTTLSGRPAIRTEVSDLIVGERYTASIRNRHAKNSLSCKAGEKRYGPAVQLVHDGQTFKANVFRTRVGPDGYDYGTAKINFTATTTTASFLYVPESVLMANGKWKRSWSWMDDAFLGMTGIPRFSGNTPSNSRYLYEWTGTPNHSPSTARLITPTDTTGSGVTFSFRPKKWLVI